MDITIKNSIKMKNLTQVKVFAYAILACLIYGLQSCSENEDNDVTPSTKIMYDAIDRIDVKDTIVDVQGGDIQLRVNNDVNSVGMKGVSVESSDKSWCIAKVSEHFISVWVIPNYDLDEREATVKIKQGEKEKSFKVTQPKHIGLFVIKDSILIDYQKGQAKVSIATNTGYTITGTTEKWIKVNSENQNGTIVDVVYDVDENTTLSKREAKFTVTASEGKDKYDFYIIQAVDSSITIVNKKDIYEIDDTHTEFSIKVNSLFPIDILNHEEWIVTNKEGNGKEKTIYITVNPFLEKQKERNYTLILENTMNKTDSIVIRQSRKFFLTSESYEVNVLDTLTASVTTSVEAPGIQWKSSDNTVFTVNSEGLITGVGRGVAYITATTSDGSKNDISIVKVKNAIDSINVSVSNASIMAVGNIVSFTGKLVIKNQSSKKIDITKITVEGTSNQTSEIHEGSQQVLKNKSYTTDLFSISQFIEPKIVIIFTYEGSQYKYERLLKDIY